MSSLEAALVQQKRATKQVQTDSLIAQSQEVQDLIDQVKQLQEAGKKKDAELESVKVAFLLQRLHFCTFYEGPIDFPRAISSCTLRSSQMTEFAW